MFFELLLVASWLLIWLIDMRLSYLRLKLSPDIFGSAGTSLDSRRLSKGQKLKGTVREIGVRGVRLVDINLKDGQLAELPPNSKVRELEVGDKINVTVLKVRQDGVVKLKFRSIDKGSGPAAKKSSQSKVRTSKSDQNIPVFRKNTIVELAVVHVSNINVQVGIGKGETVTIVVPMAVTAKLKEGEKIPVKVISGLPDLKLEYGGKIDTSRVEGSQTSRFEEVTVLETTWDSSGEKVVIVEAHSGQRMVLREDLAPDVDFLELRKGDKLRVRGLENELALPNCVTFRRTVLLKVCCTERFYEAVERFVRMVDEGEIFKPRNNELYDVSFGASGEWDIVEVKPATGRPLGVFPKVKLPPDEYMSEIESGRLRFAIRCEDDQGLTPEKLICDQLREKYLSAKDICEVGSVAPKPKESLPASELRTMKIDMLYSSSGTTFEFPAVKCCDSRGRFFELAKDYREGVVEGSNVVLTGYRVRFGKEICIDPSSFERWEEAVPGLLEKRIIEKIEETS